MATVVEPPSLTYRGAIERLGSAQKPGHGVPAYTRYVNRSIGRRLAAIAHLAGLTPNQVSVISALVSAIGIAALCLVGPGVPLAVVVVIALALGYALDSADGQLARLRGGGSVLGEWLDHVLDAIRVPALHAAVAVGVFRFGDLPDAYLLVPLTYTVVASVRFFVMMLTDQLLSARGARAAGAASAEVDPDPRRSLIRSLVLLPSDFGFLALVFVLLVSYRAFAWGYGLLFGLNALWLLLTLARRYREVADLTSGGAS